MGMPTVINGGIISSTHKDSAAMKVGRDRRASFDDCPVPHPLDAGRIQIIQRGKVQCFGLVTVLVENIITRRILHFRELLRRLRYQRTFQHHGFPQHRF